MIKIIDNYLSPFENKLKTILKNFKKDKWYLTKNHHGFRRSEKEFTKIIEENYFKNIALRSKINEKIFFNLVKEEDKIQILTSFIGSVSKMLLHTSIIGIFEQHGISYKELKSIITLKKNNVTISGTIWLISQIIIIFLRILQFYGCISVFRKNEKKNTWLVIFLLLISLPFIISTMGIGNPRYRIPLEPILFLLSIIGIKNLKRNDI